MLIALARSHIFVTCSVVYPCGFLFFAIPSLFITCCIILSLLYLIVACLVPRHLLPYVPFSKMAATSLLFKSTHHIFVTLISFTSFVSCIFWHMLLAAHWLPYLRPSPSLPCIRCQMVLIYSFFQIFSTFPRLFTNFSPYPCGSLSATICAPFLSCHHTFVANYSSPYFYRSHRWTLIFPLAFCSYMLFAPFFSSFLCRPPSFATLLFFRLNILFFCSSVTYPALCIYSSWFLYRSLFYSMS